MRESEREERRERETVTVSFCGRKESHHRNAFVVQWAVQSLKVG